MDIDAATWGPIAGGAAILATIVGAVAFHRKSQFGKFTSATHLHGMEGAQREAIQSESRRIVGTGTSAGKGGLR